MKKFFYDYTNEDELITLGKIKINEFKRLKKKLEYYFNFSIADYIISDILDGETYNHICLMINLAVANNRISVENSKILKKEIRNIIDFENCYRE